MSQFRVLALRFGRKPLDGVLVVYRPRWHDYLQTRVEEGIVGEDMRTHKGQHNNSNAEDAESDAQGLQSKSSDKRYNLRLVHEVHPTQEFQCTYRGSDQSDTCKVLYLLLPFKVLLY